MACNIEQFNMQTKHNGTVQYIKKAQVINLSNLGVTCSLGGSQACLGEYSKVFTRNIPYGQN